MEYLRWLLHGSFLKLAVILNTYRFYNASLLQHPKVEGFSTKKIRVETMDGEPTGVEVDGEYIGETPVEFSILPKALKILSPWKKWISKIKNNYCEFSHLSI